MNKEEELGRLTEPRLKKDFSDPDKLNAALNSPENISDFKDAMEYVEAHPSTFSTQKVKIIKEIKQCEMEILENTGIIIASFELVSLVTHSQAVITHLIKRKEVLTRLLKQLKNLS